MPTVALAYTVVRRVFTAYIMLFISYCCKLCVGQVVMHDKLCLKNYLKNPYNTSKIPCHLTNIEVGKYESVKLH